MRKGWMILGLTLGAGCAHHRVVLPSGARALPQLTARHVGASYTVGAMTAGNRVLVIVPASKEGMQRWLAFDEGGALSWEAEETCPDPHNPMIRASGDMIVCRSGNAVMGKRVSDGVTAWRWEAEEPLLNTDVLGNRVATAVGRKDLVILDLATGTERSRFALEDQPFQVLGGNDEDPLAYIIGPTLTSPAGWQYPCSILAQPVGADLGVSALAPRWAVPFDGFSFHLAASGGALLGEPRELVVVSRDARTGAFLWLDAHPLPGAAVRGQFLVAGQRDDGRVMVSGLDPLTRGLLWERPWPLEGQPARAGEFGDQVAFLSSGGWASFRKDGTPTGAALLSEGQTLLEVGLTGGGAVGIARQNDRILGFFLPGGEPPSAGDLPPLPGRPAWLTPGVRLVYMVYLYDGADPDTGYVNTRSVGRFEMTVRSIQPDLVFDWRFQDGRHGTRTIPGSVLDGARTHSDLFETGDDTVASTSMWLGRAVLSDLEGAGEAAFTDASGSPGGSLVRDGGTLHWVAIGNLETGPFAVGLLTTRVVRDSTRQSEYWIEPNADYPLIVRASRPGFQFYLVGIEPPGLRVLEAGVPGASTSEGVPPEGESPESHTTP